MHNIIVYNNNFYQNLIKPEFTPPAIVFQIVWPILYLLMIISFFIILGANSAIKPFAVTIFIVQLILNFIWSPVFFVIGKIKLALFISILLLLSVLCMVIVFFKISKIAGCLQIPYFLWLFFATFLNAAFMWLNPE